MSGERFSFRTLSSMWFISCWAGSVRIATAASAPAQHSRAAQAMMKLRKPAPELVLDLGGVDATAAGGRLGQKKIGGSDLACRSMSIEEQGWARRDLVLHRGPHEHEGHSNYGKESHGGDLRGR